MGNQIKNGYVVFTNSSTYQPTVPEWAIKDVDNVRQQYLEGEKAASNSFYKLLDTLETVCWQQKNRERAYLEMRLKILIQQKESTGVEDQRIDQIQSALSDEDYTTAFNVEQHALDELKQIQTELARNKQLTRTNDLFDSAQLIQKTITKKLQELLTQRFTKKGIQYFMSSGNLTIDDVYQSIIDEVIKDTQISSAFSESLESFHQDFIKAMTGFLKENNIQINKAIEKSGNYGKQRILKNGKRFLNKLQQKDGKIITENKKDKSKTVALTWDKYLERIASGIAESFRGKIGEIKTSVRDEREVGKISILTGKYYRQVSHYVKEQVEAAGGKVEQQKGDNLSIAADVSTDILDRISDELQSYLKGQTKIMQEDFNKTLNEILNRYAQETGQVFYPVVQNVKTYQSLNNFQIQGRGWQKNGDKMEFSGQTFDQFAKHISNIGSSIDANKLIFMLNNTTLPGAFSSPEDIDVVLNYISTICAAWVWDDESLFFNQKNVGNEKIHTIQLFNAGGMVVPASAVMEESIERLMAIIQERTRESNLARVEINTYQNLEKDFEKMKKNNESGRWMKIRNLALRNSKIAVTFDVYAVNHLLDDFRSMLAKTTWT